MNDNNQDTPSAITGGCLCSAIRYTVNFNEEYPWPPTSSACQCTMCRKWTSSLIAQFLVISPKQISPALGTFASFKEYMSSPGRFRGFCGDCGTSLTWRSADYTPIFDLYLGTLDEKYLVGDGVVAKTLATPNGTQYWMQNSIHGVTDVLKGGRSTVKKDLTGYGTKIIYELFQFSERQRSQSLCLTKLKRNVRTQSLQGLLHDFLKDVRHDDDSSPQLSKCEKSPQRLDSLLFASLAEGPTGPF
ncbi:hypothetical protein AU210_010721 [Fusarium oxysporum f. sp. radicis-cucumerinum]|uniref:CENP-V/GFA domain-containing protein n=1 Tax=Fusarium oxysporum f. sp. radicis-cucumerinum TaxID=327505 RepID=A0A2H3GLT7_FUSOX|nr:hypothetical protein AU210_010721 [Fusarium oxysporum f. sp. radicis-cucumerinum]